MRYNSESAWTSASSSVDMYEVRFRTSIERKVINRIARILDRYFKENIQNIFRVQAKAELIITAKGLLLLPAPPPRVCPLHPNTHTHRPSLHTHIIPLIAD